MLSWQSGDTAKDIFSDICVGGKKLFSKCGEIKCYGVQ